MVPVTRITNKMVADTISPLYVCKRIGIILTCFGGNINNPCLLSLDASHRRMASKANNALEGLLNPFTIVGLEGLVHRSGIMAFGKLWLDRAVSETGGKS